MRSQSYFSFKDFWHQIGEAYLKAVLKTIALLPFVICGAFTLLILFRCFTEQGDFYCNHLLSLDLFRFLYVQTPTLLKAMLFGLPPILLAVLYLEWDKYKKDEAPHLGGYWGWTVPNRPWSRSNFERLITGQAWEGYPNLNFKALDAHSAQVTGTWSDEALLRIIKGVSRRYTSLLRKPRHQTPDSVEWHFLINGGDELTLTFERAMPNTSNWRLRVQLYAWAGRRQPPRLAQTHTTEFVVQATNEGQSGAEGQG